MLSSKKPKCKNCNGEHYTSRCFKAPHSTLKSKSSIYTSKSKKQPRSPLLASKKNKKTHTKRNDLIAQLDRIFSVYIRLRYSIDGYATCVTCGCTKPWHLQQNGHFISRRYINTRWDEQNCNVQCIMCNEDLHGNLQKYKEFLKNKYGDDILDILWRRANSSKKLSTPTISNMIETYKEKVHNLSSD